MDVPDDRITHRRAGRLLRIGTHGNEFSPLGEIRPRLVLVVAEDGRADDEDQVVAGERRRNPLDRGRKQTLEVWMRRWERTARCRRCRPDLRVELLGQANRMSIGVKCVNLRAEDEHRILGRVQTVDDARQ